MLVADRPHKTDVKLGNIPVGREDEFRIIARNSTRNALAYIGMREPADDPLIHGRLGVYTWHDMEAYKVYSVLTKTSIEAILKASNIIVPSFEETGFRGLFGETHLYNPGSTSEIDEANILPLTRTDQKPFEELGRFVIASGMPEITAA